jgi:hypothetical protein
MFKITALLSSTVLTWGLISHAGLILPSVGAAEVAQNSLSLAKRQTITGTKISIIPPVGFVQATRFSGYQEEKYGTSIAVTEIPAPISQLKLGLTNPQELAKRGMVLLEQEDVRLNDRDGIIFKVKQSAYDSEFQKWILLLGNETESIIITASLLQELEAQYSKILRDSLLTVQWDTTTANGLTEGLDYAVEEFGTLKLAKRISNSLLYTENGEFPAKSNEDPIFVVSPSVAPQNNDLESFARTRLLQTENLTEIKIQSSNKITIDSHKAYEIIAVGKDIKTQFLVSLYQVILLDKNNYYYIMQGQVDARFKVQYIPIFQQMARSFHRK